MSKKVKSLIEKELKTKLGDIDGVAVLNPRGLNATKNNALRKKLHAKGAKMSVVKNTLAKRAVGEGKLKGFDKLLDGPSAVIYGNVSISQIARLLLDEKKADDKLDLRGIFFDAIESLWGRWTAVLATAVLFGYGHLHGYPPGPLGAILAGIFGLCLAWLRLFSGGLALPILAHIAADATIFAIVAHEKGWWS